MYAAGIDLGGTSIKGALVENHQGLVHQLTIDTESDGGPDHVLDRITTLVRELRSHAPDGRLQGVGIGSPGSIDWTRAVVRRPPNLPGWMDVNVRDEIQRRLGEPIPVLVENDANAAGLGSAFYGAGRPYDDFIMITLGTGVGGAIIYRNRVFRGSTGGAGEIGHMTIDYEGPFARSGVAGAIEAYLGQRFLSRHARYRLMTRDDSVIHAMAEEDLQGITPKMLYEAACQGDEGAIEVLAWAGHKLGCVLGSCVNLLDIRTIVVGGGLSAAGNFILDATRRAVVRFVTPGLRENLRVIQETLGNEVGMLGAARLIFEYLDEQPSDSQGTVDSVRSS
jgi:glucokinase